LSPRSSIGAACRHAGRSAQITQICSARSATSSGKDLRRNGGYLRASTMDSNHTK